MRFLPREEKFFALFEKQIEKIRQAAEVLYQGASAGGDPLVSAATQIQTLETEADELIHEVFQRLNQTFITPFDPEDIHELSTSLDNVIDAIEDAAHRMVAYHLEPVSPTIIHICDLIRQCGASLHLAFQAFEKNEPVLPHCIEVNRLENLTDKIVRQAIAELFDRERDPIVIIKLKEVYEFLEAATDYCEDVTDVLQNVVVKNS
jgi:predicted phosphate transport protein (TIGR00153 family)